MDQPHHLLPEAQQAMVAVRLDQPSDLPPWGRADRADRFSALAEMWRSGAPPERIVQLCRAPALPSRSEG